MTCAASLSAGHRNDMVMDQSSAPYELGDLAHMFSPVSSPVR